MTRGDEPERNPDDEPEVDYSDALEPPPAPTSEPDASRVAARDNLALEICLGANAVATVLVLLESLFLESAFAFLFGGDFDGGEVALSGVLATLAALKLLGSAFLYRYWSALDADVARTRPWRAATLNLIPVFDVFWFFVAYRGGAIDGIGTIEKIDGNRTGRRAPVALASATLATSILTVVVFAGLARELLERGEDLGMIGLLMNALIALNAGLTTDFSDGEAFAGALGTAALAASLLLRLALLKQMTSIAVYANDARRFAAGDGAT